MVNISQSIVDFIEKSVEIGDLNKVDKFYIQNKLLSLLGLKEIQRVKPTNPLPKKRLGILDNLLEYAVEKALIEDISSSRDVLGSQIMDLLTPRPSFINNHFWEFHKESPEKATNYFYEMSKRNNYIKTREINQNIEFDYETDYGTIELTINLSKPEKSSKEIAMAQENTSNYPMNALSIGNEGYRGHIAHAGRSNHRIIRMNLDGNEWGFQYSPYSYYNEHSIFLAFKHGPMNVDIEAVQKLLEIITQFPHYFVGSNAGLPIVGGSILTHDHYQGGRHEFALDGADYIYEFTIRKAPNVKAGIVKWPMSVIRLEDKNKEEIIKAAEVVISNWKKYTDEEVDILAETNRSPHNAFTPIARRNGGNYVLDIVLRNNCTSKEFPDGIFHPHPSVQHIKKENIGLIEVLGLAVLPPRLKNELKDVERFLLDEIDQVEDVHQEWAEDIKERYNDITETTVAGIVQVETGEVFLQVLKDAGVFKTDEKGQAAFKKFINQIND